MKDDKYTVQTVDKNLQIPLMLFVGMARIVLFNDDDPELWEIVKKGIDDKFNSMYRRMLYSTYRDKKITPAEREKARIKYLEEVGIPQDFWWPEDYEANHYE